MELSGQHILVVGLGESGMAAARLLRQRGARVTVNDRQSEETLGERASEARRLGCELTCGHHDESLFRSVDRIVLSPGVPPLPALDAAERAGIPIASEIELASWFIQSRIVAITGTNGKSTVTTLVGEMCRATGVPTFVGGNLGTPLVSVVDTAASRPGGLVVVELSSFQLERVDRFHADVAVLLNLSPDHLDRYARFEDYVEAKANIFHGQSEADAAVVPARDALCQRLAERSLAAVHFFGEASEVRAESEAIVDVVSGLRVPISSLRIKGDHNVINACAASLTARLAGVSADKIEGVLASFAGLPHRTEFVRQRNGVTYYDDSKATNVGAAVAAIEGLGTSHDRLVLIAGGKHKGSSYQALRAACENRVRAVLLIGEAAARIDSELESGKFDLIHASSLEEAVARAAEIARSGDGVLLAPACSSYDMFSNYVERGHAFQRAVHALEEDER